MADLPTKINLTIVTRERKIIDVQVDEVELPATDGEIGILPGHTPLLATLKIGQMRYRVGTTLHRLVLSWGFVEVLPDRVTILANDAVLPSQIDVAKVKEQLDHGHKMWNEAGDSEEKYTEAERVINEAEAKLASAGQAKQ